MTRLLDWIGRRRLRLAAALVGSKEVLMVNANVVGDLMVFLPPGGRGLMTRCTSFASKEDWEALKTSG